MKIPRHRQQWGILVNKRKLEPAFLCEEIKTFRKFENCLNLVIESRTKDVPAVAVIHRRESITGRDWA